MGKKRVKKGKTFIYLTECSYKTKVNNSQLHSGVITTLFGMF